MIDESALADRERLEDYLVRHDVALVKAGYFKERLRVSKEDDAAKLLPRRQEMPGHQLVNGDKLRGVWTDLSRTARSLFVASHAWHSAEHPDPAGLRLEALVEDLEWFRATDDDLVFFDYCSLFQVDRLHPEFQEDLPADHVALRTPDQHKKYHGALRHIDVLLSSSVAKVIVMPEIYDISKVLQVNGKPISANRLRYVQRGWSGTEFSIAAKANRIVGSARPLNALRTREEDDLQYVEELDYKELEVVVSGVEGLSGPYKQRKDFEGAPFFEQTNGRNYMYRKYEEVWVIGPRLGAPPKTCDAWAEMESQETDPPGAYWKVADMEHPDIEAFLIRPAATTVSVSGFVWFRSAGNGLYIERGEHNERPYYQNDGAVFIYAQKSGEWCISPILGAIGDLVWSESDCAMKKPPEGKWKVSPLTCPDVQVIKPPLGDTVVVQGFGHVREPGNTSFTARGQYESATWYGSPDDSVFIYRWRQQRWRIARVLGAIGNHVADEVVSDALEPPAGDWKKSMVEVTEALCERSFVTLTAVRSSEVPGKALVMASADGENWSEVVGDVQSGTHDLSTPMLARKVRIFLEKSLTEVRCISSVGVAYRRSMNLEDRIEDFPGPQFGQRVPVRSRSGDWVRAERGYLPLYVDEVKAFEGVEAPADEAFSCRIAGYRADVVEALPELEELGVSAVGVSPAQFGSLYAQGAVHFQHEEDREIVLAVYRRACCEEVGRARMELLGTLKRNGGRGAAQHIATVRDALNDPDSAAVVAAVEVMGQLAAKLWPKDVEALAGLLAHPDGCVRQAAALALGRAGEKAAAHLDAVVVLLDDLDLHARIAAAGALAWLGLGAAECADFAADLLVELLRHVDRQVREAAVASLCLMGPFGAARAGAVVERLADAALGVRIAATRGLASLGDAGRAHADTLVPLLDDARMRHAAVEALAKLGAHESKIAGLLSSPHWYVRRDVLAALRSAGAPVVQPHAAAVARLLADIHRDVRLEAVSALAALGPGVANHAADLRRLAERMGEDLDIRRAAAATAQLGVEHQQLAVVVPSA